MIDTIFGTKIEQTSGFTPEGVRIPITRIKAGPCVVTQVKTMEKDGYNALQLSFGKRKKEVRTDKASEFKIGEKITLGDVLKEGDTIKVTGWSKGKGFAGVVKRWHFKGGPRTHGQSDRERAPGSIGQTTTPGRVYKGKKMAGRMGGKRVTVKGLKVIKVDVKENILEIKGLVPGAKKGFLIITKT